MADTKPGILRNLRIKRVALVDAGANLDKSTMDGAHIMLFKAAPVKKDGPSIGSVHVDSASISVSAKDAARRKIEAANKEKNVKKTLLKSILGLFSETDVEKRKVGIEAVAKAVDDMDEDDKPVEKVAHDASDPLCKCADCTMHKAAPTEEVKKMAADAIEVRKQITELEKRNTELAKSVDIEKNLRLDREMTDVLKAFKAVPIDMTTDVAKFRKMKETSPEAYDRTMEILKATDAQLAASNLYGSYGTSRTGTGDAYAQLEAKADAIMEKGANGKTREQILEKVMLDNPKLVAQYRQEQQ